MTDQGLGQPKYNEKNINASKVKKLESMEDLASPAINDPHLKRLSRPHQNQAMTTSAKHYTHESAKILEGSVHVEGKKPKDNGMEKLKWIIFLIISFFLMYEAMSPTRKCPYKAK